MDKDAWLEACHQLRRIAIRRHFVVFARTRRAFRSGHDIAAHQPLSQIDVAAARPQQKWKRFVLGDRSILKFFAAFRTAAAFQRLIYGHDKLIASRDRHSRLPASPHGRQECLPHLFTQLGAHANPIGIKRRTLVSSRHAELVRKHGCLRFHEFRFVMFLLDDFADFVCEYVFVDPPLDVAVTTIV